MTNFSDDPVQAIPATRALRRSRGRWRLLAFLALALVVLVAAGRFGAQWAASPPERVARVTIEGVIASSPERQRVLRRLAEDDSIRAVIVSINSPGGTSAGGEELYEALLTLAEAKPVVAVVNELGASAAYMTAIATDRIFARRLSIVGSIGVLYRHVDAGRLLDTIGIELDKIASGALKAEPDIDGPIDPAVRASLEALVGDSFDWFVDAVAERRDFSRPQALALADGRIVTGRMALELGLIDAIGGEDEARAYLAETAGIDADAPVADVWPPPRRNLDRVARWLGGFAGEAIGIDFDRAIALDGLVSLWHPSRH